MSHGLAPNRSSQAPITQEFFDIMCKAFPALVIDPNTSMNEIQYNAGQQYLISWIKRHVQGTSQGQVHEVG